MVGKVQSVVRAGGIGLVFLATLWLAGCGGGSMSDGGPKTVSVSIHPKHAAVVISQQKQQFHVTLTGDSQGRGVTWAVDGMAGGNAAVGTISSGGLYTPPASSGTHTIAVTSVADTTKSDSASIGVTDLAGVFTYHNNLERDGTNTQEFALTNATVKTATFGKLFSCSVDGAAYTQPLWVPNLDVSGSTHNVIFVATQHDSAYAFDADASPCAQLWHANLLDAAHGAGAGETSVPTVDLGAGFFDIQPEIGVTGTPVIDPASKTLYVVSKSEDPSGTFHQRLHALDLVTGSEKFSGPVTISAAVPGNGDGSSGGSVAFDERMENQRSGLALVNGVVYIAWAAHEDADPYHGWVMGYNPATLLQVSVFNAGPNGSRGGIWMAGGAPAADSSGNLYLTTGNGTFDGNSGLPPNNDFGDSVLKISTAAGLSLTDWFTPFNQSFLEIVDLDLGSSAVVVLPDQSSGPAHLLVSGGKEGRLYLLDRDAMGNFCASCTTDSNVLQSFFAFAGFFGTPAFWQNGLYFAGSVQGIGDKLKRFAFDPSLGQFNSNPSSQSSLIYNFPGATPSISSQDTSNGIVWAIDASKYGVPSPFGSGPAVLHAYDATNVATEFWNGSQAAGNRDQAGDAVKFAVPTVANGKVYIGTRTEIEVYGLLP